MLTSQKGVAKAKARMLWAGPVLGGGALKDLGLGILSSTRSALWLFPFLM